MAVKVYPAWVKRVKGHGRMRHSTILYAKQSLVAAEGGDDEEPEIKPRYHYVEPNSDRTTRQSLSS